MTRFVSLLEGRHAREWAKFCPQLGITSAAAPTPRTELARTGPEHHFCGCGLVTRYCPPCDEWVCSAPGHIKHVCRSEGATP